MKSIITAALAALALSTNVKGQSLLYPQHFDLSEITILDGQQKTMMERNASLLLDYDADRLMTPFVRQSGLSDVSSSKYYKWTEKHPSFTNWGLADWSLEGHVGGHYVTALSLAYAALNDGSDTQNTLRKQIKERLDYCVEIMRDCQNAYKDNTEGLYGFIGGQPINQIWTGLYANNLTEFKKYGGWVPFYCQHKILAGLRDAYVYAGNKTAKEAFKDLSDWSANVISNLSYADMQTVLNWEHGGMNETLADAYKIFGDTKYLDAAVRYSHQTMVDGMKTFSGTFLDGKHANTQVPKYIGFERIWQEYQSGETTQKIKDYRNAVLNFWDDVAYNRTVCIGGNSVSEHFVRHANGASYINNLDGPESCNSNNMLKLSEDLFDDTHDVRYADFYESTMYNHIMSTQDPETGGFVYFTSLRPQSYRIYSQVNQGMWCCVGTGMENHSKYAHFAYTHSTNNDTLYVNLFIPSELKSSKFGIKQETTFPFEQKSKITITKSGTFTLAIRKPSWVENGGSYTYTTKKWKKGDTVDIDLPMTLSVEACPDYNDYVAVKYGPLLLAARTDTEDELQNEYGGEGRMDHAPGSRASIKTLSSSPLVIGERDKMMDSISVTDIDKLMFSMKTYNKGVVTLEPFNGIHHSRYACYFYQATLEHYASSTMGQADAIEQALLARTLDFVATGEQQSEAGHEAKYSSGSTSGSYLGETYRDAKCNEYVQYTLENVTKETTNVSLMLRMITADKNRAMSIYIDGTKISDYTVTSTSKNADENGFYNIEFRIPDNLLIDASGNVKSKLTFKAVASPNTLLPGLYYLRLLKDYKDNAYSWRCTDWKTGDSGRLSQSDMTYDTSNNTIIINAGTGVNNVCLSFDYENNDYTIAQSQKYLVVHGSNLSLTTGKNYLWWLNGVNKGSSVRPTLTKNISVTDNDGTTSEEAVIAWDMTTSGLDGNNTGDPLSISRGLTIFGLTSTSGTSVIKYVGFHSDIDEYTSALDIRHVNTDNEKQMIYTINGTNSKNLSNGIYIVNGKKILVR